MKVSRFLGTITTFRRGLSLHGSSRVQSEPCPWTYVADPSILPREFALTWRSSAENIPAERTDTGEPGFAKGLFTGKTASRVSRCDIRKIVWV